MEVLYVESPWKIHVRSLAFRAAWQELSQELEEAGSTWDHLGTGDLQVDDRLCGFTGGRWERVLVTEVAEVGPHTVKLLDQGRTVQIEEFNLRALSSDLSWAETGWEEVSLAGLETGGAGRCQDWWESLQLVLTEIIKPGDNVLVRRNKASQSNGVEMFVHGRLSVGPGQAKKIVKTPLMKVLLDRMNELELEEVPDKNNNNLLSSVRASRWRKPSLSPLLPEQPHFPAKILHIDQAGVVWVLPSDHLQIQGEVSRLLQCQHSRLWQSPQVGILVTCSQGQRRIRARILKISEREDLIFFLNIDSGELGLCSVRNLQEIRGDLLSLPPLAVPLKLYGVKKIQDQEKFIRGVASLLSTMGQLEVRVSVLECPQDSLPLPVKVSYSLPLHGDAQLLGNLALDLLAGGLVEVVSQWSDWVMEYEDHNLQWLVGPDPAPHSLTSLPPHPFPLAPGQWLQVTVQGLQFPLVNGEEADTTTVSTAGANMVACHLLPSQPQFRLEKEEDSSILASLRISRSPLAQLESVFQRFRLDLSPPVSAGAASLEERPGEGELVLTRVDWDWCRVRLERPEGLRGGERLFFPDYGHYGPVPVEEKAFRKLSFQQRMNPVEAVNLTFRMPTEDQELQSVREELAGHYQDRGHVKLLVRIEEEQLDLVMVSFWRATMGEGECFSLSKII